ncbi:MAG: DUF4230 domain-containing protein [Desulfatibacillaceae bacterium]
MKRGTKIALSIVVTLAVLAGGAALLVSMVAVPGVGDVLRGLGLAPSGPAPEKQTISSASVVRTVSRVTRLATVEYLLSEVVTLSEDNLVFDKEVILIARGRVGAGIDMDQGAAARVVHTETGPAITVTLPRPRILYVDTSYDFFSMKGDLPREDHNYLLALAKGRIRATAERNGIREQAAGNARELVVEVLSTVFPEARVDVEFEELSPRPVE